MEQIKFVGGNETLFTRVKVENKNATLIVPETHNAILIKDGQMMQTLGSGKFSLSTFYDAKTESDVSMEVLFMSKTAKLKLLWGTPQNILLFDETISQNFHAGFSGDFEVQIGDPRKCYLFLIGVSDDMTADSLQERLKSSVVSVVEEVVAKFLSENKVAFSKISKYKKEISQEVLKSLSKKFQNEYGISVFSFNISNIIIDEQDFKKLTSGKGQTCQSCGTTLAESDRFCPTCGAKAKKQCGNCHAWQDVGAKFCSECGSQLE